MARGHHILRSYEICRQTYIIAQKYARHLTGDTGSTGRYFSWINYQSNCQVGINVKSNLGSNSDIDNKFDLNLVLLHMLSDYLQQRFHHHLADQLLKTYGVLHTKTA